MNKKKINLAEYDSDPKVHKKVDEIIGNLCKQNQSENLEEDIVALFEDIVQFFSGREEDFVDFDALDKDQREAIYVEIRTIIEILKNIKNSKDKHTTIKTLSQNLLKSFSKSAMKHGYILDKYNVMTRDEQERLKSEFAQITMRELQKKQQQSLSQAHSASKAAAHVAHISRQAHDILKAANIKHHKDDLKKSMTKHIESSKARTPNTREL